MMRVSGIHARNPQAVMTSSTIAGQRDTSFSAS